MTALTSIYHSNAKCVPSGGVGASASACVPEKEVVSKTKQAWLNQAMASKCSLQNWLEMQAKTIDGSVEDWMLREYALGMELDQIQSVVLKCLNANFPSKTKQLVLANQTSQLHTLRDEILKVYIDRIKMVGALDPKPIIAFTEKYTRIKEDYANYFTNVEQGSMTKLGAILLNSM